jgi:asparagine synthase (glutamine-hydrolysing)
VGGYFRAVSILTDDQRHNLFSDAMRHNLQGYTAIELLREHMCAAQAEDPLSRIQYADLKTWLAGGILTKVDRMSMAHGLEVRTPFLDHPFVEWSATLPSVLKLRGTTGKFILKQAARAKLPERIVDRPKQGFSLPVTRWLRGPLHERMRAILSGGMLADSGFFDMSFVRRAIDEHRAGRADHGACLWSLLNFALFLERVHVEAGAAKIAPWQPSASVPAGAIPTC